MNSQKPNISTQGTLTPVTLVSKKSPSVTVAIASPTITPSIKGPQTSIIDSLIEENKPPVFAIQKLPEKKSVVTFNNPFTPEPRNDEMMEKLLRNGYLIEYRLYEGSSITHLVAKTRAGDNVILKIDNSQYRNGFPKMPSNDIQLERKSAVVLVPQETKLGILECLNYDICGAAFICNNSICITEKKGERSEQSFTEENFVFRTQPSISGGKIGRNLVAYPILMLSKVLENPLQAEDQIAEQSKMISDLAFDRLDTYQKDLQNAISLLEKRSKNLETLNSMVRTDLDKEIEKLNEMYQKIRGVAPDTLPEDLQTDYYLKLRTLAEKKKLREKYLNGIASSYSITDTVQAIADDLLGYVDPLYQLYMES